MHIAQICILDWLLAISIGSVSAVTVFGLAWLVRCRAGARLEITFSAAAAAGFAALITGHLLGYRWLGGVSILLCGWMMLPFAAVPVLLVGWTVSRCRRLQFLKKL